MKKHSHFLLLLLLLGAIMPVLAQSKLRLHLQSGIYNLAGIKSFENAMQNAQEFEGEKFLLFQFQTLPSEAEKQKLANLGINLIDYLPKNAWIASVNKNVMSLDLAEFQIFAISDFLKEWKLSAEVQKQKFPAYAVLPNGEIALQIHCLKALEQAQIEAILKNIGAKNIQKTPYPFDFTLEIAKEKITDLAKIPFISYISPIEPPKKEELTYRNTVGRANTISSGMNGMIYNGDGITLAIEESGIIDTLSIDFQGRKKERTSGNTVGGHKTGCAENAGSAGNYDAKFRANAWGANIMSLSGSSWSYYDTANLRMASHSYGWGVSGGYWSGAADHDQQIRQQPSMMHFYSSGNQGSDTCNYGTYNGIAAWSNLTGGNKQAKNVMTICNTSPYDEMIYGSIGPAYDGRIKPDVTIEGSEGTSYASPKAAGMMAQLYQAWRLKHNGAYPNSGLIKAFMLNTADEMYNPGPDFKTGFGRINLRRAYNCLNNNQYFADSINNGNTKTHIINVPANVKEVRVMLYWNDYQATTNAAFALVNDLNATLVTPANQTFLPWVLNVYPHPDSLAKPAIRGVDDLNNVEQITLQNPAAGNYTLNVNGFSIPQANQRYFVVYEFLYNELTLTYPIGNERFVAGEDEIIRWDNYGYTGTSGNVSLDFSTDNGATWTNIANNLPNTATNYEWTVPNVITGNAKIKVSRTGLQSTSTQPFHIAPTVKNIHAIWSCGDSTMLAWDAQPNATAYLITKLGQKYMDSIGISTVPHFKVKNLNVQTGEWFSVQAYYPQNALSRRALAWKWAGEDTNCIPIDAQMSKILPYSNGYYPDCYTNIKRPLKLLIQNTGISSFSNAILSYQVNNGTIFNTTFTGTLTSADEILIQTNDSVQFSGAGTYNIKVWVKTQGDTHLQNDTLAQTVIVYNSATYNPNYTENFDNFTNCSASWGCESVICGLSGGWFNVPNTPTILGDSIDWRTLNGATGTGGTGPDFDHTTGTNVGKYLYMETSSSNGVGCQYKQADLQSVCWDLHGTNQAELSYWFHAYGGSIGSLRVDILGENGWEKEITPLVSGDQGNVWLNNTVNLQNWHDQKVVVRFVGKSGGGFTGDLAIDDINLTTLPLADFQVVTQNMCKDSVLTIQNNSTYSNTYNWTISPSAGVTFVAGTNNASLNPKISFSNAGSYTLKLIATNTIGSDTIIQNISIIAPPTTANINANDNSICVNETLILNATVNGTAPFNYLWTFNGNSLGNTSATYTQNNVTSSNAGIYNCNISNLCGSTIGTTTITVNPLPNVFLGNDTSVYVGAPPIPFFTLNAGSGFNHYIWNGDSTFNQQYYTITNIINLAQTPDTTIWVTVTDANGCANSDTIVVHFDFNVLGIETIQNMGISLYPNPAKDKCLLVVEDGKKIPNSLIIYDLQGKEVWKKAVSLPFPCPINVENLASGTYMLQVKWDDKEAWTKIQVEK